MASKQENIQFLQKNAQRDEVTSTASGLQYEVISEGEGASPSKKDSVEVHYVGTFIDGSEFDSSRKRGQPLTFSLSGVIAGWTEGIQLMSEGATYKFYIPYHLAYGEEGFPPQIPPYSTLIFEVELISVE